MSPVGITWKGLFASKMVRTQKIENNLHIFSLYSA